MKHIGVDFRGTSSPLPIQPKDFVLFSDLRDCKLDRLELCEVEFFGCRLNGTSFQGAKIHKTRLIGCFASELGPPTDFRTCDWQEVKVLDSHIHCLSDGDELNLLSWSNEIVEAAWKTLDRDQGVIRRGIEKLAELADVIVAPLLACLLANKEWGWWDIRLAALTTLGYLRQTNPLRLRRFRQRDGVLLEWMFQALGDGQILVRIGARDLIETQAPPDRILLASIRRMMMGLTSSEKQVGLRAVEELLSQDIIDRTNKYSRLIDLKRLGSFLDDPDDEVRQMSKRIVGDHHCSRWFVKQIAAQKWAKVKPTDGSDPVEFNSEDTFCLPQKLTDIPRHFFPLASYRETPDKCFEVEGEIYKLQRRPQHPHIVVNHGNQGIQIVDLLQQSVVRQLSFAPGYDPYGIIDAWCLSADGCTALILDDQSQTVCWLSLEAPETAFDLEGPSWTGDYVNFGYLWEDSLWLIGGIGRVNFNIQWEDDRPVLVEQKSIYARKANRVWRKAMDQISFSSFNNINNFQVLRVEPDRKQIIFYSDADSFETVTVSNWSTQTTQSFLVPEYVSAVAVHQKTLFLMYEHAVYAINEQGQVKTIYSAPSGYSFGGIDTLPAREDYPASLVLACNCWHQPTRSQILVWQLEDERE